MHIIVKHYEHFNRSFKNWDSPKGKYISSKKQYQEEMAKGGFVPYESGDHQPKRKEYKPSEATLKFLHQVKDMADKKGNLPITTTFVKKLQDMKVVPKEPSFYDKLPKHYTEEGGFNNAT